MQLSAACNGLQQAGLQSERADRASPPTSALVATLGRDCATVAVAIEGSEDPGADQHPGDAAVATAVDDGQRPPVPHAQATVVEALQEGLSSGALTAVF